MYLGSVDGRYFVYTGQFLVLLNFEFLSFSLISFLKSIDFFSLSLRIGLNSGVMLC